MATQPHESYTNPHNIEFSQEERELAVIQLGARIDALEPALIEAGKNGDANRVVALAQHIENIRKIRDKFLISPKRPSVRF